MPIGERIREADISVLVHYPDDPDEGRGTIVAHDVHKDETVSEFLHRLLHPMIAQYPTTVPHIKVELRVKADRCTEEDDGVRSTYDG